MEISSILIIAAVVAVTVIIVNKFFGPSNASGSNDLDTLTAQYKTALTEKISELKTSLSNDLGKTEGLLGTVNTGVQRLSESFSGSKRFGTKGELILENALKNSGLVEGKDWIKNQNYKGEGTTLNVEFGIVHPSKLVLPIDSHFPMTQYYSLIDHRKREGEKTEEKIEAEKRMLKDIVKDFDNKAKEVRKKYTDNSASLNFSIIYCPSESLHHELSTYIDDNKEMFIEKIQRDHKATLMGPSTFLAFVQSILLGFNTFEADKKAKKFMQHWESLISIVEKHVEHIETINNRIQGLVKASNDFDKAGQKISSEIDRIKDSIQEIEEKK
jgi:DNA recombination protein RmuC